MANLKDAIYQLLGIGKGFIKRSGCKGFFYAYNYLLFNIFYGIRWRWWINILTRWAPFPQWVEIEVSTACNLRCIICEHSYWREPPKLMSLDEFKYIIDQFPKLRFIAMTGIGENFLNRDFLNMYRYVKKKWPYIYIELYDSFYFIDEKIAWTLIEDIQIDEVLISIDAATKETYEKIRVSSNFEKVVKNIRSFFKVKEESGKCYPRISFHFIVNKLNKDEMIKFLEWVDSVRNTESVIVQFTRMLHPFPEVKDLFVEIEEELIKKVDNKAKELEINLRWNADVPIEKPPVYYCGNWMMPFVFVSGEVIPCCAMNEANVRYLQKQYSLGNIFKERFRDIWRNEKYKRLRRSIREGRIPPFCFNCPMFSEKIYQ